MLTPVDEGGTLGKLPDGSLILEEYAGSTRIPSVLNGAMFALFGLYDLATLTDDADLMRTFRSLSADLAANLDLWDTGTWTRYALSPEYDRATVPYQLVHIAEAQVMADLTGDGTWASRAQTWQRYLNDVHDRGTFRYGVAEFFHRIKTRIVYSSWWPWSPLGSES